MYEFLERNKTSHTRDYESSNIEIIKDPYEEQRPKQLIEGYFFFVDTCLYYVRQQGEEELYFSSALKVPVQVNKYRKDVKVGELSNFNQVPMFIYRELLFHSLKDQETFENELKQEFEGVGEELELLKKRAPEEIPNKLYIKNDKVYVSVLDKEGLHNSLEITGKFLEDITPFNPNLERLFLGDETSIKVCLGDLDHFCMEQDSPLLPVQIFSREEFFERWSRIRDQKKITRKKEVAALRETLKEQKEINNSAGQVLVAPKLNENIFIHFDFTEADLETLKVTVGIGYLSGKNKGSILTKDLQHKIEDLLFKKIEEWELYLLNNTFYFLGNTAQLRRDVPIENIDFGRHLPERISLDYSLLKKFESSLFDGNQRENTLLLEEEFMLKPMVLDYGKLVDEIIQLDKEFSEMNPIKHLTNIGATAFVYEFAYLYYTFGEENGLLFGKQHAEQFLLDLELERLPDLKKIRKHSPSLEKLKKVYSEKVGGDSDLVSILKKRMYQKAFLMNHLLSDSNLSSTDFDKETVGSEIYKISCQAYYDINHITLPSSKAMVYDREKYLSTSKSLILYRAAGKVQKELEKLSLNPEKFKQLDEYCIEKYDESLQALLKRTRVWDEDIILFPEGDYEFEWVTVDWKSDSLLSQEEFDQEEKEKDSKLNGWLVQEKDGTFCYKLGSGDTVDLVAKYLEVDAGEFRTKNALLSDNTFSPTGDKFQEHAGEYLLLPSGYIPAIGKEYYQVTNSIEEKEYRKVERVKGQWVQKIHLNYDNQSSLYDAFLNYLPGNFFEDTLHTNSVEMELKIQITPFIVASIRFGVGFGEHFSLERGDDRKVNVRLSHSVVAVFKTTGPSSELGATVEAGREVSSDVFKTLNGSYDSYRHFFAYLQLEIFKKFGSPDPGEDTANFLLQPVLWDESVKRELLKGYHQIDSVKDKVNANVSLGDTASISGEFYDMEQTTTFIEGLKSSDLNSGKRHLYYNSNGKAVKETSIENKITYAEIDVSGFDGAFGVEGVYQNIDFHSGKDNIGEYATLSIICGSGISLEGILANRESHVQDLGTKCVGLVEGVKNIPSTDRQLTKGSGLTKYLNGWFKNISKGNSSEATSKGYLKFTFQMIFEEDGLNIQYLRVLAGGSFEAKADAGVVSVEGGAKIEKELFEISGNSTLSYVSTVFNAIAQKKLKQSTENEKLSAVIASLSESVIKEKGKPKRNTIPTTTKFLTTYGKKGSNDRFLELKNELFDITYEQWMSHIKGSKVFMINAHKQIQVLTETIQGGFNKYKMEGVYPESATWKGMGVQWLSEEQCKNYLGDLKKVLEAYYLNSEQPFGDNAGEIASQYLQSIFNEEADTDRIQKDFFEDILFPLFIESQIHETLTYSNF
ncbi:hypothetical protein MY04_3805 [Flammeovirga sp. MY04]|uniref:hypothetical protein n=1 Tax=Flammeovirga sp. MY04 TaxID=1191459 RepID=UPI0008063FBB|nr:hypothetical protein [Flammeovirga sp. MY04]ANQ51149.1 hypothetical protein MY04_3805 [Flammeovirga sp. MY04]